MWTYLDWIFLPNARRPSLQRWNSRRAVSLGVLLFPSPAAGALSRLVQSRALVLFPHSYKTPWLELNFLVPWRWWWAGVHNLWSVIGGPSKMVPASHRRDPVIFAVR